MIDKRTVSGFISGVIASIGTWTIVIPIRDTYITPYNISTQIYIGIGFLITAAYIGSRK